MNISNTEGTLQKTNTASRFAFSLFSMKKALILSTLFVLYGFLNTASAQIMGCNGQLNLSLNFGANDCRTTILPSQIINTLDPALTYTLSLAYPAGTTQFNPANRVNGSHIGQTLAYTITASDGNSCWGYILVQDYLPPTITCPANMTVGCSDLIPTSVTGMATATDCDDLTITHSDTYVPNPTTCTDPFGITNRTFTATDGSGNTSTCLQTIAVEISDITGVNLQFPADITLNCSAVNANPTLTNPANTGFPTYDGVPINQVQGQCMLTYSHTDQNQTSCGGSREILRTWSVRNMCGSVIPRIHTQLIKVADNVGPTFVCPSNTTISTGGYNCTAILPALSLAVSDNCSAITSATLSGLGQNWTATITGGTIQFPAIQNVAIGTYTFSLSVRDACSNITTCSFTTTVEDLTAPVAVCNQLTKAAITSNGIARINARTFDDGSYDNCAPVFFKVRRMQNNTCDPSTRFDDFADFCCGDIGDTIIVVLRVYDVPVPAGELGLNTQVNRSNDCMVQVIVEDKLRPLCQSPANVTVDCNAFDPTLWTYGTATGVDNCCLDNVTATENYNQFDSMCTRGVISRTFRVEDCQGLTATCTQSITVQDKQDYFVKFPDDVTIFDCNGSGVYGEPIIYDEDCELVGMSFSDDTIRIVSGACFTIERTWRISNWCTYDPNLTCIYVPNPSTTLEGPTVSPFANGPRAATNATYQALYDANANCYTYRQIIKVVDNAAPVADTPTAPDCDKSNNDPLFYNSGMQWNDPNLGQHDLCEGEAPLLCAATDLCSGNNLTARYLLYLDTDGDGVMETVINSLNAPPAATINVGNANNPNFSGGTAQIFDSRPVAAGQKFRFGIKTSTSGSTFVAEAVWKTSGQYFNPSAGVPMQLPHGTHKIKWFFEDRCGNTASSETTFTISDCKNPTVVCKNGLSVNLTNMQGGMVNVGLSQILKTVEDNCTPANQILLGLCHSSSPLPADACNGSLPLTPAGSPDTMVSFTCAHRGAIPVQLWAKDKAGNEDFCQIIVMVQDNAGFCNNTGTATIAGALESSKKSGIMEGLEEGKVDLNGFHPAFPPVNLYNMTDATGHFNFNSVPLHGSYTLTPVKDDDHRNGISVSDMLLIQKHLLGTHPITNPYRLIAADVNKSGTITPGDIVELRKLLLGIYAGSLPNNTSWRFVDRAYVFPTPLNPFSESFPEVISIAQLQQGLTDGMFEAVKVGDIDEDALLNSFQAVDDRNEGLAVLSLENKQVEAGERYELTFSNENAAEALQFTLQLNGLELVDLVKTGELDKNHFAYFADKNILTMAAEKSFGSFTATFEAKKSGKLSEMIALSNRITRTIGYDKNGKSLEVALRFGDATSGLMTTPGFEVYQNVPNPFRDYTVIGFHTPDAGKVALRIYSEAGQLLFEQTKEVEQGQNAFRIGSKDLKTTGLMYYEIITDKAKSAKTMLRMLD